MITITNVQLAELYMLYRNRKKAYKEMKSSSLESLNAYLSCEKNLQLVKLEMGRRGLTKKEMKDLYKEAQ
ncbi:MAG: hypothetical protein UHX00_10785 [Caryophanon sp.]|nr:hypothetical protein [Caryophanon sp.]